MLVYFGTMYYDKKIYALAFKFCEFILPRVSRTFTLSIKILRGKERRAILIAYLLCRILDTIEDTSCLTEKKKINLLKQFIALLRDDTYQEKNILGWIESIKDVEARKWDKVLLLETLHVLRVYYQQDAIYRHAIFPSVEEMGLGMASFLRKRDLQISKQTALNKLNKNSSGASKKDFVFFLKTEAELDRYCYYVAGTVGKLITTVFGIILTDKSRRCLLEKYQLNFSLGLQHVNIAKDFMVDKQRGWCYIPTLMLKQEKNFSGYFEMR